ncbi:hypothetical protein CBL_11321 [Carabus blaptoides fortunei]
MKTYLCVLPAVLSFDSGTAIGPVDVLHYECVCLFLSWERLSFNLCVNWESDRSQTSVQPIKALVTNRHSHWDNQIVVGRCGLLYREKGCFAREFGGWTVIGRSTPRSRYSVKV